MSSNLLSADATYVARQYMKSPLRGKAEHVVDDEFVLGVKRDLNRRKQRNYVVRGKPAME